MYEVRITDQDGYYIQSLLFTTNAACQRAAVRLAQRYSDMLVTTAKRS